MNSDFWKGYFFGVLAMLLSVIFSDAFYTGLANFFGWLAAQ